MDWRNIISTMVKRGYPSSGELMQSPIWFPFYPKPTYVLEQLQDDLSAIPFFLIFKDGSPRILLCPKEDAEICERMANDKDFFSQPPPYIIQCDNENLVAKTLVGGKYVVSKDVPSWRDLDNATPGSLSEKRAVSEINAVRKSFEDWLRFELSKRAVQKIMGIHTQGNAILMELTQNACDCLASEIQIELNEGILKFRHNGHIFMPANVHAITTLNFSCKPPGAIGYKGIGFKAVYLVCDRPQVSSGPFRFAFEKTKEKMVRAKIQPHLPVVDNSIPPAKDGWTEFTMHIEPTQLDGIKDALNRFDGSVLVFVAGKGLPLRKITLPNRVMELREVPSETGGLISIYQNDVPSYWFFTRHGFTIGQDRESALKDLAENIRREDLKAPHNEEIVMVVPLNKRSDGAYEPKMDHKGRFHSFMPTRDEFPYPWDINGNFLLNEQREHLISPSKGSWNALLLEECGQALLCFLDEVIKSQEKDGAISFESYYNIIPRDDGIDSIPQVGSYIRAIQNVFYRDFGKKPRIPIYTVNSVDFITNENAIWIEGEIRFLFPSDLWLKFIPSGNRIIHFKLDEGIWKYILCEVSKVHAFIQNDIVKRMSDKDWYKALSVGLDSSDFIPLIGRIVCFLDKYNTNNNDVDSAWIILASNRVMYRRTDKPEGYPIHRKSDDDFTGLPEYISNKIVLVHDGVYRFLTHDPNYFKGQFSEDLSDGQREAGRKFWTSLVPSIDLETIVSIWINPTFEEKMDNEPDIHSNRLEWLRFLFRNRKLLSDDNNIVQNLRLLARVGEKDVWRPSNEIWLFKDCLQGRDIETFIADTPDIPILSREYTTLSPSAQEMTELGLFFSRLGVKSGIVGVEKELGRYSCFGDGPRRFCESLGIEYDELQFRRANWYLIVDDYNFDQDIISALSHTISESSNFQHRLERLKAFTDLLKESWRSKNINVTKLGYIHYSGARDSTPMKGGLSAMILRLRDTEWIPLANNPKILKRPSETCIFLPGDIKVDIATIGNYCGLSFEDEDLIKLLEFGEVPQDLTALDGLNLLIQNLSAIRNPKSEFINIYQKLANELDTRISLRDAKEAFLSKALILIPKEKPVLRKSNEVLCRADSPFDEFLEDLKDYYPPELQELFLKLGVANKVEEIHYLRYLVSHMWVEKPPINERRRLLIQKCYRHLVNWATNMPTGQGIWLTPEGRAYESGRFFYGRCKRIPGWYSGTEKTIVYRNEPQIEELLVDGEEYVFESFLTQLRRTEEGLDPFIKMFDIKYASDLAHRKIRYEVNTRAHNIPSNLRQNLLILMDKIGPELRQKLGDEIRDDSQSQVYYSNVAEIRELTRFVELFTCDSLEISFEEVETGRKKSFTYDAVLDFDDKRNPRVYILGRSCVEVGPQLAREFKMKLRTDTLPEQVMTPVESVIDDTVSHLDNNPDQFIRRLGNKLNRYFPDISIGFDLVQGSDIPHESSGTTRDDDGESRGTTRGSAPHGEGTEEPQPEEGESDNQAPLMPEKDAQTLDVTHHKPEDFTAPADDNDTQRGSGRRPRQHVRKLTDEQRQEVGRRAELLVLDAEKKRLTDAEQPDLAERVIDRNKEGYDPYGPFDIASYDKDENGNWKQIMIEVKGHLNPDVFDFEMSASELDMALKSSSIPYIIYLVLNLSQQNPQVHTFDFKELWKQSLLSKRASKFRIKLQLASNEEEIIVL